MRAVDMVRKPKDIPGTANIDLYWEQFAEPGDRPEVQIHVLGESFDKGSVKEMRKIAKYLTKAASWLQHQIDLKKV